MMSLTLRYLTEGLLSWALSCLLDCLLDDVGFAGRRDVYLLAGKAFKAWLLDWVDPMSVTTKAMYGWRVFLAGHEVGDAPLLLHWRLHVAITELANDGSMLPSEDVPAIIPNSGGIFIFGVVCFDLPYFGSYTVRVISDGGFPCLQYCLELITGGRV
jgi:hypothetical protein